MKAVVFGLFLFVSCSLAFGQATAGGAALNAQPIEIVMPSHPQHADYVPMGQAKFLTEPSAYTFGHGERPLWEVAPVSQETPLGDIARVLREEHLKAPKAQFVKEN